MADTAPPQPAQLANGTQRQGMSLAGPAQFDQDLYGQGTPYGGYVPSIGVTGDDEVEDDRERAMAR